MAKKGWILLLVLAVAMTFSSCSSDSYSEWEDMCNTYPDQKGKVQVVSDDESNYHVEYEGKEYYTDKLSLFRVRDNRNRIPEGDVLVGWDSLPLGIWYLDMYYSYTSDDPMFIYISRYDETYIRNDYHYETDTFVIQDTDQQFVFSDMFTLSDAFTHQIYMHYKDEMDLILYSDMCPRLQIPLRLFCADDVWFAASDCGSALFEVSNELLDILNIDIGSETK